MLPVHPNPVREVLGDKLRGRANVLLTEPLGYATFSKLLGRSHLVITDSGGVQEEAPSLGKPVLVLRETTERIEGLEAGTLRLVGTDPDRIYHATMRLLDDRVAYEEMAAAENPYGDGHAAARIVAALEHVLLDERPPEPFGPGYSRYAIARGRGTRAARGVRDPRRARAGHRTRVVTSLAAFLFDGLPTGWQLFFTVALGIVLAMFLWTVVLFVARGVRAPCTRGGCPTAPTGSGGSSSCPAQRGVDHPRQRGPLAGDARGAPADRRDRRRIRRRHARRPPRDRPPRPDGDPARAADARRGKAAALNHAYQVVRRGCGRTTPRDRGGRRRRRPPPSRRTRYAAAHFADPTVGGVQSRVRIYNRGHLLTWMQDVEFGVYGSLFQMGRNDWGTAGMGGNGQFNRLSALDAVADEHGPWRDRLTEDQDLGLRLLTEGGRGTRTCGPPSTSRACPVCGRCCGSGRAGRRATCRRSGSRAGVARAVPPRLARRAARLPDDADLAGRHRRRTRARVRARLRRRAVLGRRSDVAAARRLPPRVRRHRARLRRRTRDDGVHGWVVGFLVGHLYALYTWLIWPVLARSTFASSAGAAAGRRRSANRWTCTG